MCEACGAGSRYIVHGKCTSCGWVQGEALESRHFALGAI